MRYILFGDKLYIEGSMQGRVSNLFLYAAYYYTLCIIYIFYISEGWSYRGFLFEYDAAKLFVSIVILIFFVNMLPSGPSARTYLLNFLVTIQLVPSLTLYSLAGMPTTAAATIWLAIAVVFAASALRFPRFSLVKMSSEFLLGALASLTFILMISFAVFGGFENFNIDVRQVYAFRQEASDSLPRVFVYITPILSKIIIPAGAVLSLHLRRYGVFLAFVASSFLLFGFSSHKGRPALRGRGLGHLSYADNFQRIPTPPLGSDIGTGRCDPGCDSDVWHARGADMGLVLKHFSKTSFDGACPAGLPVHRFFSNHPQAVWSLSRVTLGLLTSPYDLQIPRVIGEAYYGSVATAANTGYIGSGFAQAGIFGVLLYSLGAGLTIAILDAYGRYLGAPLITAVAASQVVTMFSSSDFLTLLLTHGMLVSFVLLSMMQAPKKLPAPAADKVLIAALNAQKVS